MPRRRRKNTILPGKTRKQREADKIRSRARYNKRRKENSSLEETDTSHTMAENRALAFDIVPIPRKVVLSPDVSVGEKYQCSLCLKTFAEQQHFTLHKNIHYFETPFRCKDCNLSFRYEQMLQKHQSSDAHRLKQRINQQFGGAPTVDNPRPFKCEECEIAFRTHVHLVKHFRSKTHITTLETLGKVPTGLLPSKDTMESTEDQNSNIIVIQPQDLPEEEDISLEIELSPDPGQPDLLSSQLQWPTENNFTMHESSGMVPICLTEYLPYNTSNTVSGWDTMTFYDNAQSPCTLKVENATHCKPECLMDPTSQYAPIVPSYVSEETEKDSVSHAYGESHAENATEEGNPRPRDNSYTSDKNLQQDNVIGEIKNEHNYCFQPCDTKKEENPAEDYLISVIKKEEDEKDAVNHLSSCERNNSTQNILNKFPIASPGNYSFPGLGNVFIKEDQNIIFTPENVDHKNETAHNYLATDKNPYVKLRDISKESKVPFGGIRMESGSCSSQIAQKCSGCRTWIVEPRQKRTLLTEGVQCMSCNHFYYNKQEFLIHYVHVHVCNLEEYNGVKTACYGGTESDNVVVCLICRRFGATPEHLLMHFSNVHGLTAQSYSCMLCNVVTCNYEEFITHWNDMHPTLSQRCDICPKDIHGEYTKAELDFHLESRHRMMRCGKCNKIISIKEKCAHNLACNNAPIQFKCKGCGALLKNKRTFQIHLKTKHGLETFKCKRCNQPCFDHIFQQTSKSSRTILNTQVINQVQMVLEPKQTHLDVANFLLKKKQIGSARTSGIMGKRSWPRNFICQSCKQSFTSYAILKRHKLDCESQNKTGDCNDGKEKFASKTVLKARNMEGEAGTNQTKETAVARQNNFDFMWKLSGVHFDSKNPP